MAASRGSPLWLAVLLALQLSFLSTRTLAEPSFVSIGGSGLPGAHPSETPAAPLGPAPLLVWSVDSAVVGAPTKRSGAALIQSLSKDNNKKVIVLGFEPSYPGWSAMEIAEAGGAYGEAPRSPWAPVVAWARAAFSYVSLHNELPSSASSAWSKFERLSLEDAELRTKLEASTSEKVLITVPLAMPLDKAAQRVAAMQQRAKRETIFAMGALATSSQDVSAMTERRRLQAGETPQTLIRMRPETFVGIVWAISMVLVLSLFLCCCLDGINPASVMNPGKFPPRGKQFD